MSDTVVNNTNMYCNGENVKRSPILCNIKLFTVSNQKRNVMMRCTYVEYAGEPFREPKGVKVYDIILKGILLGI